MHIRRRHDRARLFHARDGKCHICGGKITIGQPWEIEHMRPLAMGGEDNESNLGLAHVVCHKNKTAKDDSPALARAKRREYRHLGIKKRKGRPIPGSRDTPFKRKMDGTVVRRKD